MVGQKERSGNSRFLWARERKRMGGGETGRGRGEGDMGKGGKGRESVERQLKLGAI